MLFFPPFEFGTDFRKRALPHELDEFFDGHYSSIGLVPESALSTGFFITVM
jgi:hypothetical protein